MRDGKIKKMGCAAGGECGIPVASKRTYSPILRWTTCQVIDWLNGHVADDIYSEMEDIFEITKRLIKIYDVRVDANVFEFSNPIVTAARFGCIGCPAIQAASHAPKSSIKRHGSESPLNEIYDVWFEARQRKNRLWNERSAKGFGPIKMEARKMLFARIMDIQHRAGIVLVSRDDEKFIRECWENKVYPRGWSEKDELNKPPSENPLFEMECIS